MSNLQKTPEKLIRRQAMAPVTTFLARKKSFSVVCDISFSAAHAQIKIVVVFYFFLCYHENKLIQRTPWRNFALSQKRMCELQDPSPALFM